jgi:hypothetical protein
MVILYVYFRERSSAKVEKYERLFPKRTAIAKIGNVWALS